MYVTTTQIKAPLTTTVVGATSNSVLIIVVKVVAAIAYPKPFFYLSSLTLKGNVLVLVDNLCGLLFAACG